jgi:predicted membrane protein
MGTVDLIKIYGMSNPDEQTGIKDENKDPSHHSYSRVWVALTLLAVGAALFIQQLGVPLPFWLFSWQMLLIVVGVFQGFNHGFRGGGWAILILVGGIFLVDEMLPGFSFHRFMWPIGIVAIGILVLVRPRRYDRAFDWKRNAKWGERWGQKWGDRWNQPDQPNKPIMASNYKNYSSEDYIDSTTIFGGIHKTIVSKSFKGGDITVFMGGTEINLSQADIQGIATLDITQVMGGTKLIVPPHWEIRSQITSVLGSIEDKRQPDRINDPQKILILHGTSILGGIEIRNF